MALKYQSGEEIKKGDRVLFHGEPAEVEFVVDENLKDAASDWNMEEYENGAMIREPRKFGRAFIRAESLPKTEDLEFLSRADD